MENVHVKGTAIVRVVLDVYAGAFEDTTTIEDVIKAAEAKLREEIDRLLGLGAESYQIRESGVVIELLRVGR